MAVLFLASTVVWTVAIFDTSSGGGSRAQLPDDHGTFTLSGDATDEAPHDMTKR
jgi:hypothetical protein